MTKSYGLVEQETNECIKYSGYIDNSETDDHFFFWFFGSRSSPEKDPVVLWLNGGPVKREKKFFIMHFF